MMFLENDVLGTYIHGEEFVKATEIIFWRRNKNEQMG